MCAFLDEQRRYSHLSQYKVGLSVEFLYLKLDCCCRLISHRSDTNYCETDTIRDNNERLGSESVEVIYH